MALVIPVNCTVRFLATAAQASYRLQEDNKIHPRRRTKGVKWFNEEILDWITQHGYKMAASIAPVSAGGTGLTPLAAAAFIPNNSTSPIVLAYRGTKTMQDVLSDLLIGYKGEVGPALRDAAFAYYQNVRQQYPDREIIITGHSLGGHLAQYVGTRAYNTEPGLRHTPLVQVRTFNTAPIFTKHSVVFKNHPELNNQFINYRMSQDVVSNLPLHSYTGNTFVFPSKRGAIHAHQMWSFKEDLPKDVLDLSVGQTWDKFSKENKLIEITIGMQWSYQCRINGQYFARYRAGIRNLKYMDDHLPQIKALFIQKNYSLALWKIEQLQSTLRGRQSNAMIGFLKAITEQFIKDEQQSSLLERHHAYKPIINIRGRMA